MIVTNIMASSIDGFIASEQLEPDERRQATGFTSEEDHEFVRKQIKGADAIITGAQSMRASRGAWEQKGRNDKYPHWVVYTNSGLDDGLAFWDQKHIPRTLASSRPVEILQGSGVQNLTYGEQLPGISVIEHLKTQGFEKVLLFGGGDINKIFYNENLVDELKITFCPVIIGRSDAPRFICPPLEVPVKVRLLSSQVVDNFVFLHYRVQKN